MMELDLCAKTALVTGASRGIGKAVAKKFLDLGCDVYITSTQAKAPAWSTKFNKCHHLRLDFLDEQVMRIFFKATSRIKNIDILVNNAGIQMPQPINAVTDREWQRVMQVNLSGPMQLLRHIAPKMMRKKWGRILNISSISGITSKAHSAAYSSSKAGLIGLTKSSALDLAPHNILVNALCPGYTDTDMMAGVSRKQRRAFRESVPLGRFCRPEEIANFALFLCSEQNTYITGQAIIVDGGTVIR